MYFIYLCYKSIIKNSRTYRSNQKLISNLPVYDGVYTNNFVSLNYVIKEHLLRNA